MADSCLKDNHMINQRHPSYQIVLNENDENIEIGVEAVDNYSRTLPE